MSKKKSEKFSEFSDPVLEDPHDLERTDENNSLSHFFQYMLAIVGLVLLLCTVVMVVRWQRGKRLVIDPSEQTENFDMESQDFHSAYDARLVDGYVDDGINTIVILGDETIYRTMDDPTGIAPLIAAGIDADVTTLALPDSSISLQEASYTPEYPYDAFNLYYIVLAICSGDMGSYDLMTSVLGQIEDNTLYYKYWDVIHKIDFDKVDTLILYYGQADYLFNRPLIGEEAYAEQPYGLPNSMAGAFHSCLTMLKNRFPYMQILVASPCYSLTRDENGIMRGSDLVHNSYGTLPGYSGAINLICQEQSVSYIDNYLLENFNPDKYEGCLEGDGSYPNATGRKYIAEHILSFLNRN